MELYWYTPGKRRKALETGSQLGSGQEGSVFEVLGEPGTVVKVFKSDRTKTPEEARREAEERAKKLDLFVKHPPPNPPDPDDGHRKFAWPDKVLFNSAGLCVGYAMPRVTSGKPLDAFIYPNPKDGVLAELKLRVAIAREVASIVAEVHLHELSIRLGDMSPANFLADAKGRVTLIDIDSAEITSPDDGHVYLCPTRTSEYTAPELIGRDLSTVRRTEEQDLFGLAVLDHRLLFEGWHPFAASDQEAIETHILDEVCPLIRGGAGRPPEAPPFSGGPDFDVGDELRALFVRAFVAGHGEPRLRPKAAEWNRPLLCYEKVLRRRARRVSSRPVPRAARLWRRAVMGFFVGAAASAVALGFFYVGGSTFSNGLTKDAGAATGTNSEECIPYYNMRLLPEFRDYADRVVALLDHRMPQGAPEIADTESFHAFMENLCREGEEIDAGIAGFQSTFRMMQHVYLHLDSRGRHYLDKSVSQYLSPGVAIDVDTLIAGLHSPPACFKREHTGHLREVYDLWRNHRCYDTDYLIRDCLRCCAKWRSDDANEIYAWRVKLFGPPLEPRSSWPSPKCWSSSRYWSSRRPKP